MNTPASSDRNRNSSSEPRSRRLENLEQRFRGLEEHIDESAVKQSLSVLHVGPNPVETP